MLMLRLLRPCLLLYLLSAPINVLTARYYLRSRLWLEVVSSLENSMDLYYSFEIK